MQRSFRGDGGPWARNQWSEYTRAAVESQGKSGSPSSQVISLGGGVSPHTAARQPSPP